MLGRFYQAARRTEEAGRELRRAVELGPGVPATWLRYVQHLVETRQLDRARAAVDAACKALPSGPGGHRPGAVRGDGRRYRAGGGGTADGARLARLRHRHDPVRR